MIDLRSVFLFLAFDNQYPAGRMLAAVGVAIGRCCQTLSLVGLHKIPAMYPYPSPRQATGLMAGLRPDDTSAPGRLCSADVWRMLKGEKPVEIPAQPQNR